MFTIRFLGEANKGVGQVAAETEPDGKRPIAEKMGTPTHPGSD